MKLLEVLERVVLWTVLPVAAAWLVFGRTEMRRTARDEEHLEQLLGSTPLHNGDLIFQTSTYSRGKTMQLATRSPYNHCGIVCKRTGNWVVLEVSKTVKTTPLRAWIEYGEDDRFVIKRLRDAGTVLTPSAWGRMDSVGKSFLRRPYDAGFGWSDDELYGAELVWKVYDRGLNRQLGRLQQLKDFNLANATVQQKLKAHYGDHLPLSETVISPVSIFNSPELVTVLNR